MECRPLSVFAACLTISSLLAAQDKPAATPIDPVSRALDTDGNGRLSAEEIQQSAKSLLALDKDGNGSLSGAEIGMSRRNNQRRGRGRFGRTPRSVTHPMDVDANGMLNAFEIQYAPMSLKRLDGNRDGRLSTREFLTGFKGLANAGRAGGMRRGSGRGEGGGTTRRLDPTELEPKDGTATIPDRATFVKLSYQGEEVMIDTHLANLEFVKFQIEDHDGNKPLMYFINTKTHRGHPMFMSTIGISRGRGMRGGPGGGRGGSMRGVLVYRPLLKSPSGATGLYTFEFEPNDAYPYSKIKLAHDLLEVKSPILRGNLAYRPLQRAISQYESDKSKYEAANLRVFLAKDLYGDIAFLPLNHAVSFGRLRLMKQGERPGVRDIVLYEALPNELPRVAGIITTVRQTPLSHVNLRATQDGVPNAFIQGATQDRKIRALIGKYVYYAVQADNWQIREASVAEVERHFANTRPRVAQTPARDLEVKEIQSLDRVGFEDWKSIGVKAANLAALRKLGLKDVDVPDGQVIPFHFYDAFMNHNGLYAEAQKMRAEKEFQADTGKREKALAKLRKKIKKAKVPDWMREALGELSDSWSKETSLRCRSSTNNEDLPNFSGAGLYDSFTHKPNEGHLSKTIKQVWASLWNFPAYEEREFYRIDHATTAMAVLVHANYKGERSNGVAVTDDVVYQTQQKYYVNAQVGEDLVTNPGADSIPEEILLDSAHARGDRLVRTSNRTKDDKRILTASDLEKLRRALNTIEIEFRGHYGLSTRALFAMEVEFKVTKDGKVTIKQARPWVY